MALKVQGISRSSTRFHLGSLRNISHDWCTHSCLIHGLQRTKKTQIMRDSKQLRLGRTSFCSICSKISPTKHLRVPRLVDNSRAYWYFSINVLGLCRSQEASMDSKWLIGANSKALPTHHNKSFNVHKLFLSQWSELKE